MAVTCLSEAPKEQACMVTAEVGDQACAVTREEVTVPEPGRVVRLVSHGVGWWISRGDITDEAGVHPGWPEFLNGC
jgi:hypothetical protein